MVLHTLDVHQSEEYCLSLFYVEILCCRRAFEYCVPYDSRPMQFAGQRCSGPLQAEEYSEVPFLPWYRGEDGGGTSVWYDLPTMDNYTVCRAMNRSERSTGFKSTSAELIDINRRKE